MISRPWHGICRFYWLHRAAVQSCAFFLLFLISCVVVLVLLYFIVSSLFLRWFINAIISLSDVGYNTLTGKIPKEFCAQKKATTKKPVVTSASGHSVMREVCRCVGADVVVVWIWWTGQRLHKLCCSSCSDMLLCVCVCVCYVFCLELFIGDLLSGVSYSRL